MNISPMVLKYNTLLKFLYIHVDRHVVVEIGYEMGWGFLIVFLACDTVSIKGF